MSKGRVIAACHWARRIVVDETGEIGDITNYFDRYGDETPDWRKALSAVVHWTDNDTWSALDMCDFEFILPN